MIYLVSELTKAAHSKPPPANTIRILVTKAAPPLLKERILCGVGPQPDS